MIKTRTLQNGRTVTVHRNDGLRKRCECPRRAWPKCPHSWHFSFKWRGVHHRFPLDQHCSQHIVSKNDARAESDRLRAGIREGRFPLTTPTSSAPAEASALTFEQFAKHWRERGRGEATDTQKANEATACTRLGALRVGPNERLGDRAIGRITEDDLETAFGQLRKLAAST